nr:hypothetical protein [Streptomyces chartreusis]
MTGAAAGVSWAGTTGAGTGAPAVVGCCAAAGGIGPADVPWAGVGGCTAVPWAGVVTGCWTGGAGAQGPGSP